MSEKIVSYKGRQYRQVWSGQTKFGVRAKLKFTDGSKEFWVDASQVSSASGPVSSSSARPAKARTCKYCGGNGSNGIICHDCHE